MRIPFLLLLLPFLAAAFNIGGLQIEIDQENARYRASRQGGVMSGWLNQKTEIFLKAKSIDPLKSQDILREYLQSVKEINPSFPSSFESKDAIDFPKAFLVQFHTQAFPEFKEELENSGASVHFSFPSQALLVTIPSPSVLTTIREMKTVRWVGEYFPIYKLGPDVFPFVNEKTQAASLHLNIMLIQRGEALQGRIAKIIERRFGGQVHAMITEGFRLEITIPVQKIFLLLSLREVLYADLWRVAGEDMDIARLNGGLDYMSKVHGYNGEGVRAEVMDSGLYTSHTDFKSLNIMIHGGNGISTSHGSSVFGVVFGDGTTNPNGLGCISKANASIFAAYDILSASYTRYRHTEELVDPEGMYRAVFQTNSWGDAQTTLYTTISAEMDDIIYLNDIVILQSQSNTGNRNSRPQAWAKNIVSIGAFNHYNTLSRADDRWGGGASIGPAEDGRQKPDLCNFYDNILTPTNNNNGYTQFGGTSGATPITAGHFGVFFQMWADGVFSGGVGKERDVFDSRPHSSTAKAIMINTASQYDFNANSRDLIRVHQGWGTANLAQLHGLAQTNGWSLPILVDESEPIASLEVISYQMIVDSSSAPNFLKATLVYRDPMPAVSASRQLINNLDLMVTSPSGVVYYGNYGLNQGTCSLAGGDPSDVDNVENVFICGAESGIWTISVIGTEVIQDTNPATEIVDAFFSLVVTKGRQD